MGKGVPISPTAGSCDPDIIGAAGPLVTLDASAQRLLLALDGARADAYEWDFGRDRICCAGTLSRELGIPAEESTAAYLERVHPDDRDRLSLTLAELAPDKARYTLEYRVRHASGADIWVVDSGKAYFEVAGRRSCVLGVRRCLERLSSAAPAKEEERYRMLLQAVPSMTFEGDPDGGNVFASEQWCAYTGLTPEQTAGFGWAQAVHPDDLPGAVAGWAQAMRDGNPCEMRRRIRAVDGSYCWFLLQAKPLRGAHGRIDRWVGSLTNIEELQRTAEALRQSREDLDRAQEVGQIGWWRIDILRDVLTWSDENYRIFGVPMGTPMRYETFLAIVHPDDRAHVDSQWQAGLRGNPYDIEHRIVVGGQVKWVREKAYLEFDDTGALLGGFGITQDITERKQADQALRDSEYRYRELVENANSAIIRWRKDGTLTFFNEYAEQFFGYRADEVLGRHVGLLVPDRDSEGADLTRLTEDIARDPTRYANNINENVCHDGRRVWMSWTNRPILDERGEAIEILAIGSDITERIRAEQALRESEARFQLASEIGRSGTWDWNVASGEVVWSRGHFEILGYRLNEVRPSYAAWAERVHPEDRPGVEGEISRSMAEHADYACDFRVVWPDESIHWMSARARYEYNDDGVCRRMVGIMADVTELKEAERQLQKMNTRLTALLAERTQLADEQAVHVRELAAELTRAEQRERDRLYELLHDHVQPLLVGARLGLSGLDQRTPTATWVRVAAEARRHITEALDTARSLGVELNPPVVREQGLGPALEWLCNWARIRHRLEVDLKWDETAEPEDVATRLLLFKATRELLMNVAKHAGANQVTLAMERTAESAVQITVSDKGIGFDTAARDEAWGGSGLWNVERRLGMIGGRIEVESAPGAGTTVRLSVPLRLGGHTRKSTLPHGHDAVNGAG